MLDKAGYRHHYKVGHGWIRDLNGYTRWHAHYDGTFLEVHQDRTDRQTNLHYVAHLSQKSEQHEFGRLSTALKTVKGKGSAKTPPNPNKAAEKEARRVKHEALMATQVEAARLKKQWNTRPWKETGGKNVFAPNLHELQKSIGRKPLISRIKHTLADFLPIV